MEDVAKKHFQSSTIKSQNIKRKHYERRFKILEDLLTLDFKLLLFVVDKRRLVDSYGHQFHSTFVKNLSAKLYHPIARAFSHVHVFADEHSDKEFQQSFKDYIYREHQPTLFSKFDITFHKDEENRGIQLSDFIAGSIAHFYRNSSTAEHAREFIKKLFDAGKVIRYDHWPESFERYSQEIVQQQPSEHDQAIAEYNLKAAQTYIDNNSSNRDPAIQARVCTARLLLNSVVQGGEKEFVPTKKIVNYLRRTEGLKVSERLGREVISPLRYEGVLIVSRRKGGYKLVLTKTDLYNFVNYNNSFIRGTLKKIGVARKEIRTATKGDLDILEPQEFGYLFRFFESEAYRFLENDNDASSAPDDDEDPTD